MNVLRVIRQRSFRKRGTYIRLMIYRPQHVTAKLRQFRTHVLDWRNSYRQYVSYLQG
jgi:hypothetical protein